MREAALDRAERLEVVLVVVVRVGGRPDADRARLGGQRRGWGRLVEVEVLADAADEGQVLVLLLLILVVVVRQAITRRRGQRRRGGGDGWGGEVGGDLGGGGGGVGVGGCALGFSWGFSGVRSPGGGD